MRTLTKRLCGDLLVREGRRRRARPRAAPPASARRVACGRRPPTRVSSPRACSAQPGEPSSSNAAAACSSVFARGAPLAQPALRASEAEQRARAIEAEAERAVGVAASASAVRRVLAVAPGGEPTSAAQRSPSPGPTGWSRLGELAQAIRHGLRLLELAEVDERLDEIRRDRERARARRRPRAGGAPRRPRQALLGRARGRPRAAPDALRARRLEDVPVEPGPLGPRDGVGGPPLASRREAAAGGGERAAAVVARPDEQLAVAVPLVEQSRGLVPVAARSSSSQRCRRWSAYEIGSPRSSATESSRPASRAPPRRARARRGADRRRAPARRRGTGRVRDLVEALAEVVDRASAEAARPGERVQGGTLDLRPRVASRLDRLERPLFASRIRSTRATASFATSRSGRSRAAVRRARSRPARARGSARCRRCSRRCRCSGAGRPSRGLARGQRLEPRREQLGQPHLLACDVEVVGQGEQPRVRSSGSAVRRSACSARTTRPARAPRQRPAAAAGRPAASSSSGSSVASARCKARSSSSATTRARARRAARAARAASTAAGGRGQQRVRRAHAVALDDEQPGVDGGVDGAVDRRSPRAAPGRRSPLSATASSSLRTGAGKRRRACRAGPRRRRAPASPRPSPGGPCSASVRPSSSANSGLPRVASTIRRRSGRRTFSPDARAAAARSRKGRGGRSQPLGRAALEGPLELRRRRPGRLREQEADGLAVETARGEGERLGRGGIEPLEVVHGDDQRPAARERPQHVEQPERDRARLGRRRRSGGRAAARRRARAAAARAERRRRPRRRPRAGRSARRRRAAPRRRSRGRTAPAAPLARGVDRRLPERRLADARLALEHERGRTAGASPSQRSIAPSCRSDTGTASQT